MTQEDLERLVGYQSRIGLLRRYLNGEIVSPEGQATVQKVIENSLGREIKPEEIGNPQIYVPYVQSALGTDESRAKGLFGERKEELIGDLRQNDSGKLAKLALGVIAPVEIEGHEMHNATAEAHENYLKVLGLKEKVERGEDVPYREIVDAVKPVIEQDLERRFSEEANPDNKYLSEKDKKTMKDAILNGINRTTIGREYLNYALAAAEQALVARFQNDEDRIKYAEQTLRHAKEDQAREAIAKIYTTKLKE